jgi:hypothetical protein
LSLGGPELTAFISLLATGLRGLAAAQNQALAAFFVSVLVRQRARRAFRLPPWLTGVRRPPRPHLRPHDAGRSEAL